MYKNSSKSRGMKAAKYTEKEKRILEMLLARYWMETNDRDWMKSMKVLLKELEREVKE